MKRKSILNDEQLKVIDASGSSIVVSASAGAGKTTVLVERFIKRIIEDKVKVDEIVALTFTDAASENMKISIKKRIDELLLDPESTPEDINSLNELKSVIDGLQISTIHSFCLKLIKEYYFLLGLDSDRINHIVDDPTKEKLKAEAFEMTINNTEYYIESASKVTNSVFSLDDYKETLDSIVNVAATHYDPLKFFDSKRDHKVEEYEEINQNVKDYFFEELIAITNLALVYAIELHDALDKKAWEPVVSSLQTAANSKTYAELIENLKKVPKLPTVNKDTPYFPDQRKFLNETILGKMLASRIGEEEDIVKDYNQTVDFNNYLLKVASDYYNNYELLKKKYNVIDFNDFEHYAYKLLTLNGNVLAKKLKAKYKEIMIDEFQDTNDTQFAIISLITNNNLFVVGDIKQSIYRFRNANPKIMRSLQEDPNYIKLKMSKNHRSSDDIVNFNNSIYYKIMNYYKADTFVDDDLQEFAAVSVTSRHKPLLLLGDKNYVDKYEIFVDRVKKLNTEGVPLKDITILTRSHDKKKMIKDLLVKHNIPCVSYDKESYLTTKSLDTLYSYFKYLLNDNDLISKCSILSSSIYKVSDEDLLNTKDTNFDNAKFNKDIENLKPLVERNDVQGIINYILNINNYYYNLTVQQRADIDLFISELDSMKVNTLYDLVMYIDTNRDLPGKEALVVTSEENAVKLMTIHSSKGLEFKHVLLLSESQTRISSSKSSVLCDSELGIGSYNIFSQYNQKRNTIKRMAILAKENIESLLEYQRLFYVATTRAIESLTIIDEAKLYSHSTDYVGFNNDLALLYARRGFTSYLLNEYLVRSNRMLDCDIVDTINNPDKLKVIKESMGKTYISTNLFKTNVIESKRASEFNYTITLKEVFEFGNNVHKYFETLDINAPTDEDEIRKIFKGNTDKVIKAVNNFKNSDIIQKIKSYDIYHEYGYAYKDGNVINRGSIDFLAIEKDIIYLIDFKTDRKLSNDELKAHYKEQIRTYRDILRKKYKQVIVAYLYSIERGEFIEM